MKKVLILTYYWPPAGGPGVQRVLKFAKYLPKFGWEPIILTVQNGEYSAVDDSLLKDVPKGIKVYKTKTLEPFSLYKNLTGGQDKAIETYALTEKNSSLVSRFTKWVRLNIFIPDARVGWKPYAVKKGLEIIREENIDVILSSSPPHSLQLAAKAIASEANIPWVADFRDLWLDAFYIPTEEQGRFARRLNAKLEKSIISSATKVISTSQEIIDDFKVKAPNSDYAVVYNGYDADDFNKTAARTDDKFIIRYFGSISSGQNPEALFKALVSIKGTHYDIFNTIIIELYGKIDNTVHLSIQQYKLEETVQFKGYVAHSEVTNLMSSSDCLLLLLPRTKYIGMVPGKLFEYMQAKHPIIALGEKKSEVNMLLEKTKAGEMFDHSTDIAPAIIKLYNDCKLKGCSLVNDSEIETFSRIKQTENLANELNKLL